MLLLLQKNSAKQERHNRELKAAARGNGHDKDLQPSKGMPDKVLPVERPMTDDELINEFIEFIISKRFSVTI